MKYQRRVIYKQYHISPWTIFIVLPLLIAGFFLALPIFLVLFAVVIIVGGFLMWRAERVIRQFESELLNQMNNKDMHNVDDDIIDITDDCRTTTDDSDNLYLPK